VGVNSDQLAVASYGGQAVIEGVMMRGAATCAVAMRSPNREIVVYSETLGALYKSRVKKIPFLRGLLMLWDGLGLGLRALTLSANVQSGEDKKIEGFALYATLTASLAFTVAVFFVLPTVAAGSAESRLGWNAYWGNVVEGVVRVSLLVGYLWAVGRIPNIRRLFAYHGAEHQTINAYEGGAQLTPENVSRFPLEHTRCGTSFLLTLVLFSIVFFSLLGPMSWPWRLSSRVLMLPVLAGLAYEYTRWAAAHLDNPAVRWLIKPNLALQRLTTRRPSLDMLEVAIAAFQTMRTTERELVPV
jgi:uncharacterized protein YqhQ